MRAYTRLRTSSLRLGASIACALFALASSAQATTPITKTLSFEFGPGTANAANAARNFNLPTGRSIKVDVTIKRLGPSASTNDIPCVVDVFAPSQTPPDVGPLRGTKTVSAKTTNTTVVAYDGSGSDLGCTNPWRVSVRFVGTKGQTPSYAVQGTISVTYIEIFSTFTFSGGGGDVEAKFNVPKGTTTKTITFPSGSGTLVITGGFHTDPLDVMHLNTYYKLTVKLKRGSTVVATSSGYSSHAPDDKTPKLKLFYFIAPESTSDSWSIEIVNDSPVNIVDYKFNNNMFGVRHSSYFQSGCN